MNRQHPLAIAALACAAALPLGANASSFASSASDSSTTSLGSASDSLRGSSDSSSRPNRVAEGDYRIIEVAQVDARPGFARLTLRAVAEGGGELRLELPQAVVAQAGLAAQQLVSARQRPYGIEFAQGEPRQGFYLVLADEWYRELQSNAVAL